MPWSWCKCQTCTLLACWYEYQLQYTITKYKMIKYIALNYSTLSCYEVLCSNNYVQFEFVGFLCRYISPKLLMSVERK